MVNADMSTSDENIFACGDCAEYEGINYAIWPQALEQGKVAGANAAGDALTYTTVSAGLSFHGMNTGLYAIGDNGKIRILFTELWNLKTWDGSSMRNIIS